MKKLLIAGALLLGATIIMCSKNSDKNNPVAPELTASGKVTVTDINYNGWDKSCELKNGLVRVVVVPAVGRIMFYGFENGDNILWDDPALYGKTLPYGKPFTQNGQMTWANFGGDKVWPTEQSQFPVINGHAWPPDHWFDGGAHQVSEIENGVRITSQVSAYCGAHSIREITLDPNSSQLFIRQTIRKVRQAQNSSVEPINYTIWNVTQIRTPLMAILNLNPASSLPNKISDLMNNAGGNLSVQGDVAIIAPDRSRSQKVGADSDHWLGAIVGDVVIGEFFTRQPGTYPDGGLSAEVYTSPQYTELELLSPFSQLSIGESMQHDISWRLFKLPGDAAGAAQKRDAAIEWLNVISD